MKKEKRKTFASLTKKVSTIGILALGLIVFGSQSAKATTAQCTAISGTCQAGFCAAGQVTMGTITCDVAGQFCCAPSCASVSGTCSALGGGGCPAGSSVVSGGYCSGGETCCAAPLSVPCDDPAVPNVPPGCVVGGGVPAPGSGTGISFINPLNFVTVEGVFGSILTTLQGILVLLSLVFIVIGAVLYITSAGKEKQTTAAKNAITAAMIGLAIGIAAPSFLKEIATILGWGSTGNAEVDAAQSLAQIVANTLDFLLAIVGVLGVVMLVLGGTMYLTSAGDEKRIDTAKAITKWAIIGIAVALGAMVIVRQIAGFFA